MSLVLVVEDNENLAYGLQTSLELEGHQVELTADGAEGLQRALDRRPDLLVLDLMLPGLDGYRVLKALREAGSDVPVMVLTALLGHILILRRLRRHALHHPRPAATN